jgi:hypothetical protein
MTSAEGEISAIKTNYLKNSEIDVPLMNSKIFTLETKALQVRSDIDTIETVTGQFPAL